MNDLEIINSSEPVSIYYDESNQASEVLNHFHYHFEIILVIEGSAEFIINSKRYIAEKNSMLFISGLENHSFKVLTYPYKRYVISITRNFTMSMFKDPSLISILVQRPETFQYITKLDDKMLKKQIILSEGLLEECKIKDSFWLLRSSNIITGILIDIFRYDNKMFPIKINNKLSKTIFDIQCYITKNFNKEISLDELSYKFKISKYHLSRSFKEVSGYNLKDYIILNRLIIAKEILCHTSHSITDISTEVGYNNVNHFIRIFKQHEKISPLQYRKLQSSQHNKNNKQTG